MPTIWIRWAAIALFVTLATGAGAQTNVLFIFDASGSMKAKAKGETRIAAAKRAMSAALKDMPGGVRLGLLMYGHRRAKDCTDIELVSPIGADDAASIDATVQAVAPRGETPIAAALQKAAKSFAAFRGQQNTIVLVTDGIEECKGDPCAAARALKAAGLDLKVHVVGYMLDARQRRSIQCVTDETGGQYFDASDPGTLKIALAKVRAVVQAPTPPAVPSPEPVTIVASPVAPPSPKAEAGVKLVFLYKSGGQQVDDSINLWVLGEQKDLAGKRPEIAQVWSAPNGHILRDVRPGKYVLRAQMHGATWIEREFPLEIKEGDAVRLELPLDVAKVRLQVRLAEGAKPYDGGITWEVSEPQVNLEGKRKRVTQLWNAANGAVHFMPAGELHLGANLHAANWVTTEKMITVLAGEEQVVDLVLPAGKIRMDARLAAGGPVFTDSVNWNVYRSKKSFEGKREKLAGFFNAATGTVAIMPAGEWVLAGALYASPHVEVEQTFKLAAGEEQVVEPVFNAAPVDIDVQHKGAAFDGQVGWKIGRVAAKPGDPPTPVVNTWRTTAKSKTHLAAGSYLIEVEAREISGLKGQGTFQIQAGTPAVVKISLAP